MKDDKQEKTAEVKASATGIGPGVKAIPLTGKKSGQQKEEESPVPSPLPSPLPTSQTAARETSRDHFLNVLEDEATDVSTSGNTEQAAAAAANDFLLSRQDTVVRPLSRPGAYSVGGISSSAASEMNSQRADDRPSTSGPVDPPALRSTRMQGTIEEEDHLVAAELVDDRIDRQRSAELSALRRELERERRMRAPQAAILTAEELVNSNEESTSECSPETYSQETNSTGNWRRTGVAAVVLLLLVAVSVSVGFAVRNTNANKSTSVIVIRQTFPPNERPTLAPASILQEKDEIVPTLAPTIPKVDVKQMDTQTPVLVQTSTKSPSIAPSALPTSGSKEAHNTISPTSATLDSKIPSHSPVAQPGEEAEGNESDFNNTTDTNVTEAPNITSPTSPTFDPKIPSPSPVAQPGEEEEGNESDFNNTTNSNVTQPSLAPATTAQPTTPGYMFKPVTPEMDDSPSVVAKSNTPTSTPTFHPTLRPTRRPTYKPTAEPSSQPTSRPTLRPTKRPTPRPTPQPSSKPTPEPTELQIDLEETIQASTCFESRNDLLDAIDLFLSDQEEAWKELALSYGWPMGQWCFSSVDDLRDLFSASRNTDMVFFNEDIRAWDVSRVTRMGSMFRGAASFTWDLSMWDISSVEDFKGMFEQARRYSRDLCSWGNGIIPDADVEKMFAGTNCQTTQDPDLTPNLPTEKPSEAKEINNNQGGNSGSGGGGGGGERVEDPESEPVPTEKPSEAKEDNSHGGPTKEELRTEKPTEIKNDNSGKDGNKDEDEEDRRLQSLGPFCFYCS